MQRFAGHLLASRRRAVDETREHLALEIGKSYGTIVLYERGQVVPPGAVLGRLADALECSVADFFETTEVAA